MEYLAHQGIEHRSTVEAIIHFITSQPVALLSAVIFAAGIVILLKRQNEMKAKKVSVKVKER